MASSKVDIPSSAPFGCILRDRNRHDRCRESSTHAAFEKNIKNLVRGHLHSCISMSSGCAASDENSTCQNKDVDSWVGDGDTNNHRILRFASNNRKNNDTLRWSRNFDRCAPQKARGMVQTTEKQSQEAELVALSNSPTVLSSGASSSSREDSPAPSDTSPGNLNIGASSLVQIWEKRLNHLHSTKSSLDASSTGSSSCSYNDKVSSVGEPSTGEAAGPVVERYDARPTEDPFAGWESDRTALSDPPRSSECQKSGKGESERVRIVDIIQRLKAANQTQLPLSSSWSYDNDHSQFSVQEPSRKRERPLLPDKVKHKVLQQVVSSPRIRGRQALKDLLLQLERDRHRELETLVERRPVSSFTKRGRIQSLIRLRLLQRDVATQDKPCQPTPSETTRLPQGSSIMSLRDRFRTGFEQITTVQNVVAYPRSPHREIVNNNTHLENSSDPNQITDCTYNEDAGITEHHNTLEVQSSVSNTRQDVHEEASPSSDVRWKVTSSEPRNLDSQKNSDTTASLEFWDENDIAEELEVSDHEFAETNYDWIGDISRPQSYWEGCRQARYQEVLNNSDKGDIRQLLERRTVSNFLASDFRERMDRLIVSRLERQTYVEEEEENGSQEVIGQLMSVLQRYTHPLGSNQEEREEEEKEDKEEVRDEKEEEEEEEEEQKLIRGQYHEASHYFDQSSALLQMPLPSASWSWNYQDNEVGDDSGPVTSISSPQHSPSQPYTEDSRQKYPSYASHNSTDMELVHDLRGQMEQLYHELSDLRKSIKGCMDMQMILQQSMKQEFDLVRGEGKKSYEEAPKKGNCCICHEMQVDSLLYRCGHMCTCLKCAHELQWSTRKCPICCAPIIDVVRAYVGSYSTGDRVLAPEDRLFS